MSQIKVEGTRGAVIAKMGVNLNYPDGEPDELLVYTRAPIARDVSAAADREEQPAPGWARVPLRGSWFTAAFEGPMSNLQRVVNGEDSALVSPVADALRTMAVVEACYASSATGGTPIPEAGA
jgi:predicted dehydrogenase